MSELSDYRNYIEKPQNEAYKRTIAALQAEVSRLQAVLSAEQATGEGLREEDVERIARAIHDAALKEAMHESDDPETLYQNCKPIRHAQAKAAIEAFNRQPSAKPGTVITGDIRAEMVAGE